MQFILKLGPLVWVLSSEIAPNPEALGLEIVDVESVHQLADDESDITDKRVGFQRE